VVSGMVYLAVKYVKKERKMNGYSLFILFFSINLYFVSYNIFDVKWSKTIRIVSLEYTVHCLHPMC
jgi:hypothetical protein